MGVGQWGSIFVALHNGLGKNLALVTGTEQARMASVRILIPIIPTILQWVALLLTVASQAVLASRTLLLVSLCLSKLSVLLVIRSLFCWEKRRKTLLTDVTILVVTLWGFAAALTLSVRCSPDYVLGGGEAQCPNHVRASL